MWIQIKNYPFFAFLGIILLIVSCREEDNSGEIKNNLLGTWILTIDAFSSCSSDEDNYLDQINCTANNCIRYKFQSDSLGDEYIISTTTDGVTINEVGTFTVTNDKVTLCFEDEDQVECRSYNVNISASSMTLFQNNSATGCKEEMLFDKED